MLFLIIEISLDCEGKDGNDPFRDNRVLMMFPVSHHSVKISILRREGLRRYCSRRLCV